MKRKGRLGEGSAITLAIAIFAAQACGSDEGPTNAVVTDRELAVVMTAAIQDEYHAEEVYLKVLNDFGDVLPFLNIVVAEVRH
jgi:hypothetical protein